MEPELLPDDVPPEPAPPAPPAEPALLLADASGIRALGTATVDSDADGVADTALVPGSGSDVLSLATDLDGDGVVDVLTTVHGDGSATTATFPDHPDHTDHPDPDAGWGPGWHAPAPPAPVLDPETGAWTRSI